MKKIIQIVQDIDPSKAFHQIVHPECGGNCIFIGTVRRQTQGKEVHKLQFEAYESMAISELNKLADEVASKWPIHSMLIEHVVGEKNVTEPVVLIGTTSAHRKVCFEACEFLINTLKERIPIWKKEFFDHDEVWVSPKP